jgi:gas vesicle protein
MCASNRTGSSKMTVEERHMENDTGGRFIWFCAGATIGAAIALLYAPKAGTETRRLIREKSREGADAVAETSRDMYERGRQMYEKGRRLADEAADLVERGKKIVEQATSTVAEEMKDAVQKS